MKVRFGIMGTFSTRWVCDTNVPWVRVTEEKLVYERRDGVLQTQKLKYINGLEVTDEKED